jgi:flavin reductase (DIM6/NTAB) family NADH-FMN oxidoreductase RutF
MTVGDRIRSFSPSELTDAEQYRLVAGTVVPRPIALVVTQGPAGPNAAPFSFFNMLAVSPPMLVISVAPRRGQEKDTIRNLRHCPEFVVHIPDRALAERMNACSESFPEDVDEIAVANFVTAPSAKVAPPRLAEFPVQFECRVSQTLELGTRPHTAIIGEIVHMHVREGIVADDFRVSGKALDAIGRISGQGEYVRLTDTFFMKQPE